MESYSTPSKFSSPANQDQCSLSLLSPNPNDQKNFPILPKIKSEPNENLQTPKIDQQTIFPSNWFCKSPNTRTESVKKLKKKKNPKLPISTNHNHNLHRPFLNFNTKHLNLSSSKTLSTLQQIWPINPTKWSTREALEVKSTKTRINI